MKTISAGLDAHLNTEVTTLCTCWRIERKDGVVLGFTTLDEDIEYNGVVYESEHGYGRTAISNNSDFSVDNLDVTGIIDSDKIKNEELRNGLFNFADVYIFLLNYADLAQGEMAMRRGWFGEVTLSQRGEFTAELRGLNQALSHNTIEVFTPECRADFCDKRCKLNAVDFTRRGKVTQVLARDKFNTTALPNPTLPTTVGAHKYWRVIMQAVRNPDHGGFADMKFFDQQGVEITGGTVYANSDDTSRHNAAKARDGNPDTNWSTPKGYPSVGAYWVIYWPTAKDIKEFAMTATAVFDESPTSWRLEYTDDDGAADPDNTTVVWTLAKSCAYAFISGGEVAFWSLGSATTAPISAGGGVGSLPPPFEGASTYNGGTIKFLTGNNAGKAMEVETYSNGTATLFEPLPFDIAPGDVFDIIQGCDKAFETCKTYDNAINFRGEPDVPGQDEYLSYPDSHA